MSKFRVLVDGASGTDVLAGDIVTLWRDDGSEMKAYYMQSGSTWWIHDSYLEPITTRTLTVGETYASHNGHKWLCVAVDGDLAWMRQSEIRQSAAYCFKTDGENICQSGGDWDIKFEPVVEWVDTRFSVATRNTSKKDGADDHVARIRFPLIDGKPDWSQATVTEAHNV